MSADILSEVDQIHFEKPKKLSKTSRNNFIIWIPKKHIKNGTIDPKKKYWVTLQEVEEADTSENESRIEN